MIRLMLVDDHALVRKAVAHLLASQADIKVVAEAATGEEALEQVRVVRPDLVIMDIMMPGMGGVEAIRHLLAQHEAKVVVLTGHDQVVLSQRLLKLGVMGYVTKQARPDELLSAIRQVQAGGRYVSSDLAQKMAVALHGNRSGSVISELSEREYQVLLMLVDGATVKQIAQRLNRSEKTIGSFRYRLFDKLGVKRDVELVMLAVRYGLLDACPGSMGAGIGMGVVG